MVSVIIPVYNGAEFLEDCLRSVMNQTYRDIEIIVIDDGSTDESYEICHRLAKEDGRIRLLQQANAGVSTARNNGIREAKGEFITFVDADDAMLLTAIESLVEYSDYDFVIGSYETFRYKWANQVIMPNRDYRLNADVNDFVVLDRHIDYPWGKLFRTKVIIDNSLEFNKEVAYGEDHIFNIEYCRFAQNAVTIKDVVYRYRLGGLASSVKYHPNMSEMSQIRLREYFLYFMGEDSKTSEYIGQKVQDELMWCAEHYLVHCGFVDAVQKMNETLELFVGFFMPEILNQTAFDSLREYIVRSDSKGLLNHVQKVKRTQILRKKIKKAYYSVCKKRI